MDHKSDEMLECWNATSVRSEICFHWFRLKATCTIDVGKFFLCYRTKRHFLLLHC